MSHKKWTIKNKYSEDFAQKFPGYKPIILQLLYDRGLDTHQKIDEFLNPDYAQGVNDPFLFQDMEIAVARILKAIQDKEKIFIQADYDADGVTSAALMKKTLNELGGSDKNISVFIPHREIDGYGLNLTTAQKVIDEKFNLVITLDCGVTNIEPIKKLKDTNIDTIIVDHHLEGEKLPPALAILNCSLIREKYPFKKLAGVGMAFKLAQALFQENIKTLKHKNTNVSYEAFEKWLLDLVTIGTIGDISPILGENRILVKYGLMVLNKTPRKGLRELIRTCSLQNGFDPNENVLLGHTIYDLNIYNISYQIVPRINAVGRIDYAETAYKLLITDDEVEAIALARDVHEKNLERQKIADKMMGQAKEIFGKIDKNKKILITAKENWLPGVVGLVAGKLSDEFNLPVIIFSKNKDKYIGSGRSVPEFNITQALQECVELLEKFGGHSQACGLTIIDEENYKRFIEKINKIATQKLKDIELIPHLEIDAEVKLTDLNWDLWNELKKFEPFAEANPLPLFLIKGVKIESIETMGKNNTHLRFYISQGSQNEKAISFGTAKEWLDHTNSDANECEDHSNNKLKVGDIINIVVEFGVNEWNGNRELQYKIVDYKKVTSN